MLNALACPQVLLSFEGMDGKPVVVDVARAFTIHSGGDAGAGSTFRYIDGTQTCYSLYNRFDYVLFSIAFVRHLNNLPKLVPLPEPPQSCRAAALQL